MRIIDSVTGQRLSVDEAYERFFDGFCDLGTAAQSWEANVVLSHPMPGPVKTVRRTRVRKSRVSRRGSRHLVRQK